jgi:hypothetical protein
MATSRFCDTAVQTQLAARIATYAVYLRLYGTTPTEKAAVEQLERLPSAIAQLTFEHPLIVERSTRIADQSAGFARTAIERRRQQQQHPQQTSAPGAV